MFSLDPQGAHDPHRLWSDRKAMQVVVQFTSLPGDPRPRGANGPGGVVHQLRRCGRDDYKTSITLVPKRTISTSAQRSARPAFGEESVICAAFSDIGSRLATPNGLIEQVLKFKLQLQLQDASRYRCTLEVAIRATRRSYRVLNGPKSTVGQLTYRVPEVRMVENVVCIGAQREG